jgi:ferredoxin
MKKRQQSQLRELMSTVVEGGYCIGCGACTLGHSDGPIRIELDHHGCYHARDGRLASFG